jgi:hypothetical protein
LKGKYPQIIKGQIRIPHEIKAFELASILK